MKLLRKGFAAAAALAAAFALAGCAVNAFDPAGFNQPDPAAPYIGRNKSQILACAGQPYGRYRTTSGENLIYRYSGAGPVPRGAEKGAGKGFFGGKEKDDDWSCTATLSFTGELLADVTFAPREVESRYSENGVPKENLPHCSFSLPSC